MEENIKKVHIETYGCQMNISDSEVVASILESDLFKIVPDISEVDIILINTCSVRDNAEQRVRKRLREFNAKKKKNPELIIGILGCMAERLKQELLEEEKIVDIIVGPDGYRNLPSLLSKVSDGNRMADVILSDEETYADISPVRYNSNGVSAFISIMRGCNNYCSYCIVPYTRGNERSRNFKTIIKESKELVEAGYREVTLLGQNVNSYKWTSKEMVVDFPDLIKAISIENPLLRIRFATSHPKDISDKLIECIANHHNICNSIHLPVQSGSSVMLEKMNRKYSRKMYLEKIETIKRLIPDCSLSTDVIAGFCGETEEDHNETLSLFKTVCYDSAFMFKYSVRPGTPAAEKFDDNVLEKDKKRRLQEIINLQQENSLKKNKEDIGKWHEVLIEGYSKRSEKQLSGRNQQNKVIVFPDDGSKPGEYINVYVKDCTSATLIGDLQANES